MRPHPSIELFHPYTQDWFSAALGTPTPVQEEAWPAIARGGHTLVSAPTGTGKTLSAFLVFIDQLKAQARAGTLKRQLQLIYISPLKALAGDIRENLTRPLHGIRAEELRDGLQTETDIVTAVRTGDTPNADRRKMLKTPPHILITTPESLYLLLTSLSGQTMLKTARAVILDELHALIDTKRGAHLMLSLARLDVLCERPLQRIGLSATIQPLSEAAAYLTGTNEPVTTAAPVMRKDVRIEVTAPIEDMRVLPEGTIWPEIARSVYEQCYGARSVIAFVDGRMYAEKLAYQVNLIAGEGFARTHHGCVSKEQRQEAEHELRGGRLRLLVATSSMELGIDVGEIDRVLQIGFPKSISSLLQRLGRAGHNPGRVSVMHLFPRTAAEGLYCGLTASVASAGGIERLHPPRLCLDVLAQHLVSMATGDGYTVDEALALCARAYPFREVTREDLTSVLGMLAGDYEHQRDLPVRPRILYDRINGRVDGDAYSRMLAVSAGGTIPDTGQFSAKTENGVKIGELDEEFVFEQRVGYKFMLGSFAWKITAMDKDTVFVAPSNPEGAEPPFWRNAWLARKLQTGLAFGQRLRAISEAGAAVQAAYNPSESPALGAQTAFDPLAQPGVEDGIIAILRELGLDEYMARNTVGVILRQLEATGVLPDDRTVIAEHFADEAGDHQLLFHSIFGRQVNAPLSILLQEAAQRITGEDIAAYEDDDGILLMARGGGALPEGLLQTIMPNAARTVLEAVLPATPLFNMSFRYNAGRALMMGVRKGKRQPLWIQRLRGAEMLDAVIGVEDHPLIRETKRECLEDYWDLPGLEALLQKVQSGTVRVRELYRGEPSPLSLPLRRQAEANFMYDYFPSTKRINQAAAEALDEAQQIRPAAEQLARVSERTKIPDNAQQLHSLLMIEGDLLAGEIDLPVEWFEALAAAGRALYIEPGLWIAAEHAALYEQALAADTGDATHAAHSNDPFEARCAIVRRALRYRGAQDTAAIASRYVLPEQDADAILRTLQEKGEAVAENGLYYHADLYARARNETVAARRKQAKTQPPQAYAALLASRLRPAAPPSEQLSAALRLFGGRAFPAGQWESALLPARVNHYRPALLDTLLTGGEWFWRLTREGGGYTLCFNNYGDIDWDADLSVHADGLDSDERFVYEVLLKRGASFVTAFGQTMQPINEVLFSLMEKGLVHADSFVPVRQWLDKDKTQRSTAKQRVSARVMAVTNGRWDLTRPLKAQIPETAVERALVQTAVLCRETAQTVSEVTGYTWPLMLEKLRVWEYTGRARRGYFVEGLSGAQFIRAEDYTQTVLTLENPPDDTVWLSASDPSQPWGRVLAHTQGRAFLCVPGTAVALKAGLPVAAFERHGLVLRIFDDTALIEALTAFKAEYAAKRIFPDKKRITVKQYPPEALQPLETAGFTRVMMDFTLYGG